MQAFTPDPNQYIIATGCTSLRYIQSITLADAMQVFFHLTVRKQDETILETTRLSEDGVEGSGIPKAFILGKGAEDATRLGACPLW